jgi:protein-S-isoprenylcysteine O-methyltransferase Ste14
MTETDAGTRVPQDSRLWDVLAALPLMLLCAFGIAGVIIQVHRQWPGAGNAASYALIAAEISGGLFLSMQLIFTCLRRLPLAKSPGFAPRLWALAGANSSYAILLLPKENLGVGIALLSASLICCGALGSVIVLMWLGRGFAIFPQARLLAIQGPYRLVRHPLYLCEQISLFGVCMPYLQPWAFLIILIGFGLQFPRMAYEEDILARTFPRYAEYAARTPMIIPGWGNIPGWI